MIISNSQAEALLDALLGGEEYTPEADAYIGLVTSAPGNDGSGYTEVSGGSYARVNKTNNLTNFPAAASRTKSNGTEILFPTASAPWGTIVGVCVFFVSTGGSAALYAPLTEPRPVISTDVVSFAIGQLEFSIPA